MYALLLKAFIWHINHSSWKWCLSTTVFRSWGLHCIIGQSRIRQCCATTACSKWKPGLIFWKVDGMSEWASWTFWTDLQTYLFLYFCLFILQIPQQLSALTLYRYEQSVLDYCHAHLSLHLNVGMEPPTQALGGLRPAGHHTSLMAALPSEPVLPCSQTHSLHQWAAHTVRIEKHLCLLHWIYACRRDKGNPSNETQVCGERGLSLDNQVKD